ncbi:MAG: acyl-CoA dehydrogenase family protein, partial [Saprospiraceae bacterium]|nr:acyl-CoA dehydrogenase family protein [Saprospiraceae bacterium]
MATTNVKKEICKGGEFLTKDTDAKSVFIPEEKNEEQKMIQEMVDSFVQNEIVPDIDRLEKLEEGLAASKMETMGALGLLGTHMPEEYGGMN